MVVCLSVSLNCERILGPRTGHWTQTLRTERGGKHQHWRGGKRRNHHTPQALPDTAKQAPLRPWGATAVMRHTHQRHSVPLSQTNRVCNGSINQPLSFNLFLLDSSSFGCPHGAVRKQSRSFRMRGCARPDTTRRRRGRCVFWLQLTNHTNHPLARSVTGPHSGGVHDAPRIRPHRRGWRGAGAHATGGACR